MSPDLSVADVAAVVAGLALLWLVPGYVLWLRWPRSVVAAASGRTPPVDIIVTTFNEVALIADKIANLRAVAYPSDALHVWIVDGASDDGTAEIVEAAIADDARFHLLRARTADKTHQLNVALRHGSAEWVMVSDADARLRPDTLRAMIAAGADGVAVVGAQVCPVAAHPIEQMHWRITNRLRLLESRRGGGAAVAAPCYMFRRSLLRTFPDDVVADDIHVTFAAALRGQRAVMIAGAVDELRAPQTLAALIGHKIRKSRAYLREILRFLPLVRRMRAPVSSILLWRAAHLSIVPALVVLEIALAAARVASSMSVPTAGAAAAALVLVSVCAGAQRTIRLLLAVALTLVLTFSMLVALVSYPVMTQTACFPRITAPRRRGRPEGAI